MMVGPRAVQDVVEKRKYLENCNLLEYGVL
jgi:hypothetical protein